MEIDDHRSMLEAAKAKEKEVKALLDQRKELVSLNFATVEAHEKKMQQAIALKSRAEAAIAKEKQTLDAIRSEMASRQREVDAKKHEVDELVKAASEQVPDEDEAKKALEQVEGYFRDYLRPMVAERARAGHASVPQFSDDEAMEVFVAEKAKDRCTAEVREREGGLP